MAVSVAVCDIFNVKERPDLETGLGFVQGHWKLIDLIDCAYEFKYLSRTAPSVCLSVCLSV